MFNTHSRTRNATLLSSLRLLKHKPISMIQKLLTITFSILIVPFISFASGSEVNKKKHGTQIMYDISGSIETNPDTASTIAITAFNSFNSQVMLAIEEAKARYKSSFKGVILTRTNSSNALKYLAELETVLTTKGYQLLAHGGVSMPLKGFRIVKHVNCFEIIIGSI